MKIEVNTYQGTAYRIFKILIVSPELFDMIGRSHNSFLVYFPYSSHPLCLFLCVLSLPHYYQNAKENSSNRQNLYGACTTESYHKPARISESWCIPSTQVLTQYQPLKYMKSKGIIKELKLQIQNLILIHSHNWTIIYHFCNMLKTETPHLYHPTQITDICKLVFKKNEEFFGSKQV